MESEQPSSPSLPMWALRNAPRFGAAIGMAAAIDGDANLNDALGWWVTGWKTVVGAITFEALGRYKYGRGQGEGGSMIGGLSDRFRGSRGMARLTEATLCAYAIHEALSATVYSGGETPMRTVLYTTLGLYGASALGRLRN